MQKLCQLTLANAVAFLQERHDAPLPTVLSAAVCLAVSMPVTAPAAMTAARQAVHEVHAVVQMLEYFFCVVCVHAYILLLLRCLINLLLPKRGVKDFL